MIGIRHENKSQWERRVPLVPADVGALVAEHGIAFEVQQSPTRAFAAEEFQAAGASVVAGPLQSPIVLGVKEIPEAELEPGRVYVFFSHTIKGQPYNMAMLRRLLELGCTLIDYELIVDGAGRRSVFFGRHAGLAGMIDALWLLGRRWQLEGLETPFAGIKQAIDYPDAEAAKAAVAEAGARLDKDGLPEACRPLVCGFAGYGHVSQGAQEIFDLLPATEVAPQDLPGAGDTCLKTVFREKDMVVRRDGGAFELQEYYDRPELYRGRFADYLPHLTLLVNGIYWEARYPRLVSRQDLAALYQGEAVPRLCLIADISCDIEGAIECTVKATDPGEPAYVFEPLTESVIDGIAGEGPVILAVDTLPCELPVDASVDFSRALRPLIPALAKADFSAPLDESGLPPALQNATIVYRGKLTGRYRYLEESL
jgi:alpha-aminoadipic semialdehyde synthase